ncbi:MAG: hypothetical protein ABJA98_14315 [Acidobacteriota bacterium]
MAALFFQHEQLLVVAGHHPTPSVIQQRLEQKQFADVYEELSVECVPDGKLFFHDLQADGLHAGSGASMDIMYEQGVKRTIFDGNWREHKTTEAAYLEQLTRADVAYSGVLTLLIDALKTMPAAQP